MEDSNNSKPIRVLHVFSFFDQGGVENFVMNVYRNLDRGQIQFDFAFSTIKDGFFDDEARSLGGNIYFFDSEKKSLWNYYKNLRRIVREYGPYSAIHSHVYYFSGCVLLIARLLGIKVRIAHSHETEKGRKPTFIRKCYERVMRWMIKRNATHWLSCSDAAGEYVFGKGVPYQVLYNGIDLKRFSFNEVSRSRIRKDLGFENAFVVMNVGRFAEQKNHHFIVSVFQELLRGVPNAKLVLIGTGPMRKEIEDKCIDLGIKDNVTILFNIQNTEEYYDAADAFILPSLYEGMGIVVIESQACGLYTLISDKVTREVGVTEISEFLPIEGEDASHLWVEKLVGISKMNIERSIYNSKIIPTPFNVDVTVSDLVSIYTSKL